MASDALLANGARGSVCRDRRFRGATLRKRALRRPRAPRSDQWRRASRRVFLLSRRPPRSLFLALPHRHATLRCASDTCSGLGPLGFRCGSSRPQLRFYMRSRAHYCCPRHAVAATVDGGTKLGCPGAAPTRQQRGGGQQEARTPTDEARLAPQEGRHGLVCRAQALVRAAGGRFGGYFAVFEGGEWRASRHDTVRGHPRGGPGREHAGYLHS